MEFLSNSRQFYHAALIIRRVPFFTRELVAVKLRSKVDKLHILFKTFHITILSTSSSVVPQENYARFIFVLACTQGLTFSFLFLFISTQVQCWLLSCTRIFMKYLNRIHPIVMQLTKAGNLELYYSLRASNGDGKGINISGFLFLFG